MFSKILVCCFFAYAACGVVVENVPAAQPYSFAYDNTDEFGTRVTRQETGDEHNNKVGSYSYIDPNGITRAASYVADALGFRVNIETNEPGTKTSAPADVSIVSTADVAPALAADPRAPTPVVVKAVDPAPVVVKAVDPAPVVVKAVDPAPVVVKTTHPDPVTAQTVLTTPIVQSSPITYAHHPGPFTYAHQATPITYAQHPAPFTYAHHATPFTYAHHPVPVTYGHPAAPVVYGPHVAPVPYTLGQAPITYTIGRV